ncbi:amyloid-beta-like protein [Amphibalanus amphitrite]|uniref:amyloid-beta-like protein n=1 Tax=Amphibalanus amphitrite TaxID=1232801 RepID=UPI001C90075C|nr:amyloid-beta-like protein [Amphibalanus amphitrite]
MAGKELFVVVALLSISKFTDGYVEAVGASSVDMPQPRSEPQVAMVCDQPDHYHNQYMDSAGRWVSDLDNKDGCLKNKEEILEYCKRVYPKLEITNIVESTHSFMVDDWCKLGHDKCQESYLVKPYRCLEGKFQSDALLVPEPCQFDHIHNSSWCWDFDRWNQTADKACRDRGMALRSFAMLLPCGTDIFTGVEFVCCPLREATTQPPAQQPFEKNFPPQLTSEINIDAEAITLEPELELEPVAATRDPYFTRFDPRVEHDAFKAAERRLESAHRRKIKRIMQRWTELEDRYQKIKAESPAQADQFKTKMTAHFQKLMDQLKDQGAAEKHQLVSLHQQRIVAHINERKKDARACYVRALGEKPIQTNVVHKCLSRLTRALFKDRHHTISHFRHLLTTDPETASAQQTATAQHLHDIDLMVNNSLQMLERFPSVQQKILPELSRTVAELRRQDSTPAELMGGQVLDAAGEVQDMVQKAADDRAAQEKILAAEQRARDEKLAAHEAAREELHRVEAAAGHRVDDFDPETMEDETLPGQNVEPVISHAQASAHTQGEATYQVLRPAHGGGGSGGGRGLYFTVALASIALTVALVAGALTLRRRQRAPRSLGFVEVDQTAAPEEPHVTQMQVNGYENPTYRYFESK